VTPTANRNHKSAYHRRKDVDEDRDPRSMTVDRQCTTGKASVQGPNPAAHHTRSRMEWMN